MKRVCGAAILFAVQWLCGAQPLILLRNGVRPKQNATEYTATFFTSGNATYSVIGGEVDVVPARLYKFYNSGEGFRALHTETNFGFDTHSPSRMTTCAPLVVSNRDGSSITYLATAGASSTGLGPVISLYVFDPVAETFINRAHAVSVQPQATIHSLAWFSTASGTYLVAGGVYYNNRSLFVYKFDASQIVAGMPLTLLSAGTAGFDSQYKGVVNAISAFTVSGMTFIAVAGQSFDGATIRMYKFDEMRGCFTQLQNAVDQQPQRATQAMTWLQTPQGRYLVVGGLRGADGSICIYKLNVTTHTLNRLNNLFENAPANDIFALNVLSRKSGQYLFAAGSVVHDTTTYLYRFDPLREQCTPIALTAKDQSDASVMTLPSVTIGALSYLLQGGAVGKDGESSKLYRINIQ